MKTSCRRSSSMPITVTEQRSRVMSEKKGEEHLGMSMVTILTIPRERTFKACNTGTWKRWQYPSSFEAHKNIYLKITSRILYLQTRLCRTMNYSIYKYIYDLHLVQSNDITFEMEIYMHVWSISKKDTIQI